jgi:hypothetical protein
MEQRPDIRSVTSGAELARWYWLKTELQALARRLGVSTAGGKQELAQRIAARLDGLPPPAPVRARGPSAPPLRGVLTLDTVLPAGQKMTQTLRDFLGQHVGPGFHFDGHMRRFFSQSKGQTLAAAVAHWKATRDAPPSEIGDQFELNRFTREWFEENPGGTRQDMLKAWRLYRSLPREARGKP